MDILERFLNNALAPTLIVAVVLFVAAYECLRRWRPPRSAEFDLLNPHKRHSPWDDSDYDAGKSYRHRRSEDWDASDYHWKD